MRNIVFLQLLAIAGCADVLGIEDAHERDSSLDSGGRSDAATAGSAGSTQDGNSDEDDGSQGSNGPKGSGGSAGSATSPDDSPADPEPELPPGDSDGGVAGSHTSGGSTGAGASGASGGTAGSSAGAGGTSSGAGGTSSSGGSTASGGSAGGGGAPSLACQTYCAGVLANCTGQFAQYRSEEECLSVCALLPPGGALSLADNTVSCRQAEVTLAALAPAAHCKNAGPAGNGTCGDTCEGYCSIVLLTCQAPAAKHPFANLAKCTELCKGRTDLDDYGTSPSLGYGTGKTQQCLLTHATAASADPEGECESAVGREACAETDD